MPSGKCRQCALGSTVEIDRLRCTAHHRRTAAKEYEQEPRPYYPPDKTFSHNVYRLPAYPCKKTFTPYQPHHHCYDCTHRSTLPWSYVDNVLRKKTKKITMVIIRNASTTNIQRPSLAASSTTLRTGAPFAPVFDCSSTPFLPAVYLNDVPGEVTTFVLSFDEAHDVNRSSAVSIRHT